MLSFHCHGVVGAPAVLSTNSRPLRGVGGQAAPHLQPFWRTWAKSLRQQKLHAGVSPRCPRAWPENKHTDICAPAQGGREVPVSRFPGHGRRPAQVQPVKGWTPREEACHCHQRESNQETQQASISSDVLESVGCSYSSWAKQQAHMAWKSPQNKVPLD